MKDTIFRDLAPEKNPYFPEVQDMNARLAYLEVWLLTGRNIFKQADECDRLLQVLKSPEATAADFASAANVLVIAIEKADQLFKSREDELRFEYFARQVLTMLAMRVPRTTYVEMKQRNDHRIAFIKIATATLQKQVVSDTERDSQERRMRLLEGLGFILLRNFHSRQQLTCGPDNTGEFDQLTVDELEIDRNIFGTVLFSLPRNEKDKTALEHIPDFVSEIADISP